MKMTLALFLKIETQSWQCIIFCLSFFCLYFSDFFSSSPSFCWQLRNVNSWSHWCFLASNLSSLVSSTIFSLSVDFREHSIVFLDFSFFVFTQLGMCWASWSVSFYLLSHLENSHSFNYICNSLSQFLKLYLSLLCVCHTIRVGATVQCKCPRTTLWSQSSPSTLI